METDKIKSVERKIKREIKRKTRKIRNQVQELKDKHSSPIPKTVCVSGYFDPLHVGHLEYLEKASRLGHYLIVIVNNDHQTALKKGKAFMPCKERIKIMRSLRVVNKVIKSVDTDRTVCKTLASMRPAPDIFCNGGDQTNEYIPEAEICQQQGIELVDGLGAKIQSSSWLIEGGKDIKKR